MVSQQIGLGALMFGFGQLCECLGGIIFTFVTFSPGKHFHLCSGVSLCLSISLSPVPISLLGFAFVPLCLFVPPIASANLSLKNPFQAPFQKCSPKHEFYMPCTQSSVNTFTDHCGCTHPITDRHPLTGPGTHDPAWPVITSSSWEEIHNIYNSLFRWILEHAWSEPRWNASDQRRWLPDVLLIINHFWSCEYLLKIYISGRNERGGIEGEQQWVWQTRWSS